MRDRLRVVHVVEDLHRGGLEQVVQDIVTGLDADRFAAEVLCLAGGGEVAEEIRAAGIRVEILDMASRPSVRFLVALARRLRRATIVHCHGYTACTAGRVAAVLAGRSRIFAHVHTLGYGLDRRQWRIERLLSLFSRKVICVAESVRDFVVNREGIQRGRTAVVYNGVADRQLPDPADARRRLGIPERARVIGCVASLTPHKGHAVLLEAIRTARLQLPDLCALLVGDGPLRLELETHARVAGIDARFTGRVANVGPALAAMDVLSLLSPEREGFPLALIEGMAASRPLIGSRVGGIPEAIREGVTGFLCQPGDPTAAAACIRDVLADRHRARAMGEAARRTYLEKFTRERMLSEIEQLYGS